MALYWVIGVCFAGGLTSLFLASVIFKEASQGLINNMVSLAVGTLLTTAFLELIPHAIEEADNNSHDISFMVLIGILIFFILEKLFIWRHCHGLNCNKHEDCEAFSPKNKINGKGSIIFIGDLFHNFVDGILIASAFLVNINLGLVTAFSMLLHCLPQEMSTFSILLHSGVSKIRAYTLNIASSFATLVGALLSFYILSIMQEFIPYVLAVAASSMIYIAISDLMPGLHKKTEIKDSIKQISIIFLGVILVSFIHSFLH